MDLVADNSFYSCFLNDINETEILIRYLDNFKHHIGPRIKDELSKSNNYIQIANHQNLNYFPESQLNISAIVSPLFSSEEKHKGEQSEESQISANFYYCARLNIIVQNFKTVQSLLNRNI